MKEESQNPGTDLELEARLVALVLGEASEVERDELNRLIAERPELAALKEEFETVHGLLRDIGSSGLAADEDDWKLSVEKRGAVLSAIGGEAEEPSTKHMVQKLADRSWTKENALLRNLTQIAAVFCIAGFFGLLAVFRFVNGRSTPSSQAPQLARSDQPTANWVREFHGGTRQYFEFDGRRVFTETAGAESNWAAVAPNRLYSVTRGTVQPPADGDEAIESRQQNDSSEGLTRDKIAFGETQDEPLDAARTLGAELDVELREPQQNSEPVPDVAAITLRAHLPSQDLQPLPRSALQASEGSRVEMDRTDLWADGGIQSLDADGRLAVDNGLVDGRGEFAGGALEGGEGMGGGGGGFEGGTAAADDTKSNQFSGARELEDQGARAFGVSGVETQEKELALPTIAGMESEASGKHAEVTSHFEVSEAVNPRYVVPQSESRAFQQDFEKLEELDEAVSQEFAERKDNAPSGDELSFRTRRTLDRGMQEVEQMAEQDLGDLKPEQAQGWRYKSLPETGQSAASGEFYGKLKLAPAKRRIAPAGLNESNAADEAFSTFSLHVSDVSFKLAQAALAKGEWPESAKVRIEEFVNAFDYGDPMPSQSEKVACRVEQSIHPFLQQRNLLRVSMRTAAAGRSSSTPLRLTFLLDNSGSMERFDRQQTVRRAFALLAQQLTPIDQVTLISFARQPRLLADRVSGVQTQELVHFIDDMPSEGGTNIEAALQLAFEKAREQQEDGAQNRIVLLTDGAVNLGDANPESLSQMITTMRDAGIAFDAAGISAEGLNDEILEALTRQGDGRYYMLDSAESADDGFARQIAGALRPSAKNVKVQIEFNPKRVGSYKLLGFEKHLLKQEDFRNDKVDAAEMAAAEAGVAMYQFEARPEGEGDIGSVSVRFLDVSTGQMIEKRWPVPYESVAPRPDQAAPSLRIAASAALFAAKLRGEPLGESVELDVLIDLIAGLPERDRNAERVQQLQQMIEQARQVSRN